MTDARLSCEPDVLRKTVRESAEEALEPLAEGTDGETRFNTEAFEEMAGMGGDCVLYATAVEEIDCASSGLSYAAPISFGSNLINRFGSEEQRDRYLKPLASGGYLGSWTLTDPDVGSDAGGTNTTATKGDGALILNGKKKIITHVNLADTLIIFAISDPTASGSGGITSYIVETSCEGFSVGKLGEKMGLRSSPMAELIFEDCFVPDENVTGEVGTGLPQALEALDGGRISVALSIRSPKPGYYFMEGQYRMLEETEKTMDENGSLHTDELAAMDEDGYFQIMGRTIGSSAAARTSTRARSRSSSIPGELPMTAWGKVQKFNHSEATAERHGLQEEANATT